eukprot:1634064-Pleurochrysis_carterae.AAC.1
MNTNTTAPTHTKRGSAIQATMTTLRAQRPPSLLQGADARATRSLAITQERARSLLLNARLFEAARFCPRAALECVAEHCNVPPIELVIEAVEERDDGGARS